MATARSAGPSASAAASPARTTSDVEGVVELLANGSGFLRLGRAAPTSDDDVYISAAQVKRCELVSGDRVGGPVRPPRRSERFPSLVRVDTINGRPADEVAEGTRFDDLPVAFPTERLELGSDDPTVKAIEWLTPFGKGSRVVDRRRGALRQERGAAPPRRRARERDAELETSVVLAGVRPEEIAEWREGPIAPAAALTFAASADAQAQAVEHAVEQGRRVAARGGDAVVLIDTLEGLPPRPRRGAGGRAQHRRRRLADRHRDRAGAARRRDDGHRARRGAGRRCAASRRSTCSRAGTLRPELLVGEAGAEAIADAVRERPSSWQLPARGAGSWMPGVTRCGERAGCP